MASREFWVKQKPGAVLAWYMEWFDVHLKAKKVKAEDRLVEHGDLFNSAILESVIDILVTQSDLYIQPDDPVVDYELLECYKRVSGDMSLLSIPEWDVSADAGGTHEQTAPVEQEDELDGDDDDLDDEDDDVDEEEAFVPSSAAQLAGGASRPTGAAGQSQHIAASPATPLSTVRRPRSGATPSNAARSLDRAFAAAADVAQCGICGEFVPAGLPILKCNACGLRADLPMSHPINQYLRGEREASRRVGAAAAATPAGQSAKTSEQLSEFDRHMKTLAEQPHPVFMDGSSVSCEQAMEAIHTGVYDIRRFRRPSKYLIDAIRAGKLTRLGLAQLQLTTAGGSEASTRLEIDGSGQVCNVRKGGLDVCNPPLLASLEDFNRVVNLTILPSLVDKPKALVEWLVLTGTIMELSRQRGWAVARDYLSQTLESSVATGSRPALLDTGHILSLTTSRFGSHGGGASQPRQQLPARGETQGEPRHCNDYNWRVCARPACRFMHVCSYCDAKDHVARECKSAKAVASAAKRSAKGGGPGPKKGGAAVKA